jgi:UPF0716 family protein affecting phage T7 exclusion
MDVQRTGPGLVDPASATAERVDSPLPGIDPRSAATFPVMRIRTWLFAGFVIVPIIEIVVFYFVGTRIGIWPTLALVVMTAFLGSWLVARQGRETWFRFRGEVSDGRVPAATIVHGAMILIAGALLLTPGFLTDAIGFALLIPGVREALRRWGVSRMSSGWIVTK